MSKRVVAIIDRGNLVDKTPVCVWAHEIPILEAIHGNVIVPEREKLAEKDVAIVIKSTGQVVDPKSQSMRLEKKGDKEIVVITSMLEGKAKTFTEEVERIPLAELIAQQLRLNEPFDGDPEDEYNRLQRLYGMHPKIEISMVEHIYGRMSEGRFEKALGVVAEPA